MSTFLPNPLRIQPQFCRTYNHPNDTATAVRNSIHDFCETVMQRQTRLARQKWVPRRFSTVQSEPHPPPPPPTVLAWQTVPRRFRRHFRESLIFGAGSTSRCANNTQAYQVRLRHESSLNDCLKKENVFCPWTPGNDNINLNSHSWPG